MTHTELLVKTLQKSKRKYGLSTYIHFGILILILYLVYYAYDSILY